MVKCRWIAMGILLAFWVGAGCNTTRSISYHQGGTNYTYRGELSLLEFLKDVSAENQAGAGGPARLVAGKRVMLLQSGQLRPDAAMIDLLKAQYHLVPVTGIPSEQGTNTGGVRLLHAARAGGVDYIVAYWGSIQTQIDSKGAGREALSWVPFGGWFVANKEQRMKIHLLTIVVDVATGTWAELEVASRETTVDTSASSLRAQDNEQVLALKADAYGRLAAALANTR